MKYQERMRLIEEGELCTLYLHFHVVNTTAILQA